jgi:hypothetical protein
MCMDEVCSSFEASGGSHGGSLSSSKQTIKVDLVFSSFVPKL